MKEEIIEKGKLSDEELKGISANKKLVEVPSIQTLSAMTKIAKTDEVKGMQIFVNDCYVAGSKAWEDDAVLFMALSTELTKVLNSVKANLKNL